MSEATDRQDQDYADELDRLAAEAEAENAGAASEGEYMPGGEDMRHAGADPQTVEMIKTVATVGFAIMGARRGDHWPLSDEEAQALAEPAAQCLEKYAPDIAVGPEVALVTAAGLIVAPRLMADRAIAERQERERQQRQQQQEGGADAGADRPESPE